MRCSSIMGKNNYDISSNHFENESSMNDQNEVVGEFREQVFDFDLLFYITMNILQIYILLKLTN